MDMTDFANGLLARIARAQREHEPESDPAPAWVANFREAREHDEPHDEPLDEREDFGDEVPR